MKVIRLLIKRIKGIREVQILAKSNINEIAGQNGAGKSTVLDSIVWAIAGKRTIDPRPITDGFETGEILLETDDFLLKRIFMGSETKLAVISKTAGKLGQRDLDVLFGEYQFDPLALSREDPRKLLGIFQRFCGPEFCEKLSKLDIAIEEACTFRKFQKRDLDKIGQIPIIEAINPVNTSEIATKLQNDEKFNEEQRKLADETRIMQIKIDNLKDNIRGYHNQIVELHSKIKFTESLVYAEIEKIEAIGKPEPLKDLSNLHAELSEAGAINERYAAYKSYCNLIDDKAQKNQMLIGSEEKIKLLRGQREKLMSSANLPVEGLSFDSDGISFRGIPFEQLSTSEKLRICARLVCAMDAKFKVIRIADGSLLDEKSFAELQAIAEETGFQFWIETVGNGHGDAILLEEGKIKNN